MNSPRLLILVALIILQFGACFTEKSVLEEKTASEEDAFISSDDSKNNKNSAEDEVETSREAVMIPPSIIPSANEKSDHRPTDTAEDTLKPEDDDTDDGFLNGNDSILNILYFKTGQEQATDKELADYYAAAHDQRHLHQQGWFMHQLKRPIYRPKPLVMKEPTLGSLLTSPMWFKLQRNFARTLKASGRN